MARGCSFYLFGDAIGSNTQRGEKDLRHNIAGRAIVTVIVSFLILISRSPAFSADVTLFERKFIRSTGTPVTEIISPLNLPAPAESYRLIITNGNADGTSRCSSATVELGGTVIVGPSDLNQQVPSLTMPVKLGETNRLSVTLKSKPGSFLAISIIGTDSTAPRLTITAPNEGNILGSPAIAVSGTIDDPYASVTINGIPATNSGGNFQGTIPLTYGPNTVVVTAKDYYANESAASVKVILDNVRPVISIDPVSEFTTSRTIEIKGRVDDLTATTVSVQGRSITLPAGGGAYSFIVDLTEGLNTLTVTATDSAGNTSSGNRSITLDTIPPGPPVPDPLREITNLTTIVISGSAEPDSRITITGGIETITDATGRFSATVGLNIDALNTFLVRAVDKVGNESSAVTVSIMQDSVAPSVLGYALMADPKVTLLIPVSITLSKQPDPATVTASNISISGSAGAVAGTYGISGNEVVFTPSAEFPANQTFTLTVGQGLRDRAGNSLSSIFVATFDTIRGPAFITGEVYDDTLGLPLSDDEIKLVRINGAQPDPMPSGVSDDMGRFGLQYQGGAGDAILEISKTGYTKVFRKARLLPNKSQVVFDARLTPVETVTVPVSSGAAITLGENVLSFGPSSFDNDAGISIAPLSGQGPGLRLPTGWSPVYGVDISYDGGPLKVPASLSIKNVWAFTGASGLVGAYLDEVSSSWVAVDLQVAAGSIDMAINRLGQYLLIKADTLPVAPAMPQGAGGQILTSVDTTPDTGTATVAVEPPAVLSRTGAQGLTKVVVTTETPMPSGTALEVRISETYSLTTGDKIDTAPFTEDITLYAWPEDGDDRTISASFPATPSKIYPLGTLIYGKVNIDAYLPSSDVQPSDNVMGDMGGTVTGPDGQGIVIPPSSLTEGTVFTVSNLNASDLPSISGYRLTYIGGLTLDMQGGSFKPGAYPLFIIPGLSAPEGTKVIVAKVETIGGKSALRAVATARVVGGRLAVDGCLSGPWSPTTGPCIQSGRYAFYAPDGPFGFIDGEVLKAGLPYQGAVVSVDNLPFRALSGIGGRFNVISLAGGFTASAVDSTAGQTASATGSMADGQTMTVSLILSAVHPTVVDIAPIDKSTGIDPAARVTVTFSNAVDPNTVNGNSFSIYEAGFPNTRTKISGHISMSSKNTVAVFLPDAELKPDATYHVRLTSDIKDTFGNTLIPFESVFTISDVLSNDALPAGALRASLPDAEGYVIVRGGPGLAAPGSAVVVINKTKNIVLTVMANNDGSFEGKIRADMTDEL
ncbi:MAG: Ig-like domain-containing protein, partial [Nitrospirae bacterium]|nr:Ig-like domain-containing protein [Nitrospirota bacterium]